MCAAWQGSLALAEPFHNYVPALKWLRNFLRVDNWRPKEIMNQLDKLSQSD